MNIVVQTTQDAIIEPIPRTLKQIIVQGHRGGYKPDNTIKTFLRSLESSLEAIELDVSIFVA